MSLLDLTPYPAFVEEEVAFIPITNGSGSKKRPKGSPYLRHTHIYKIRGTPFLAHFSLYSSGQIHLEDLNLTLIATFKYFKNGNGQESAKIVFFFYFFHFCYYPIY